MDRKKLQELATCQFIEHGENMVFLGAPGTGKPHQAVALGLKAVQHGYRTLFTAALPLIAALTKAYMEVWLALLRPASPREFYALFTDMW